MTKTDPWADTARSAIAGDHDAFTQLYKTFWPLILSTCRVHTNNEEDAIDAAQQTFICVHRFLPNFKFESKFSSWLHHICVNECYGIHRKNSVRPHGHANSLDSEVLVNPALEQNMADRLPLLEALGELTTTQYELFYLHDVQGLTHDEIARATGVTSGTTKRGLFHTRKKLRKLLGVTDDHKAKEKSRRAQRAQVKASTQVKAQAAQSAEGSQSQ